MSVSPASEIRSNIVSYFIAGVSGDRSVFNNGFANTMFVVTFLQLINTSNSAGDAVQLQTVSNTCAVHSGSVGTGTDNRFPLTCEIALQTSEGLKVGGVTGTWEITISGYYTPLVISP